MKLNGKRFAALEISPEEYRSLGKDLVNQIAEFLARLPSKPVTPNESPGRIRQLLGISKVPEKGTPPIQLLNETAKLLFNHSLFNGHPRFWGYITSSAAPIGSLADLLASSVNPNVGAWALSPIATEIERQVVHWIAEMIGYSPDCGGLLVSGGNMANFVAFLAARRAKANWNIERRGFLGGDSHQLRVYASKETHNWIIKAADLFGLGTDSIRWISVDEQFRMNTEELEKKIREDLKRGTRPFLVVGTAGTVQTGAIDPLPKLASICRRYRLWFHVDGAYGGFAAMLPDSPSDLRGMGEADSVAVDPHKWLYAPLEAGCVLVRKEKWLRATFRHHIGYYRFSEARGERPTNFLEYGPQNSRGFRALKVWLAIRQAGRKGYSRMVADDIQLSQELFKRVKAHPELEALTQSLSITTFRYVPNDLKDGSKKTENYLNRLNMELLTRLQNGGKVYLSNAEIRGKFALRACIVNFRTSRKDIEFLPKVAVQVGRQVHSDLKK